MVRWLSFYLFIIHHNVFIHSIQPPYFIIIIFFFFYDNVHVRPSGLKKKHNATRSVNYAQFSKLRVEINIGSRFRRGKVGPVFNCFKKGEVAGGF